MRPIRAIVLAGGFAKRLWPLTLDRPKALLPIKEDLFVIDLIFWKLDEAGIGDVIVSTNKRFVGQFKEWASRRGRDDIKFHVEEAMNEEEKLGALLGLATLVKELPKSDYLVLASDNIFSLSLKDFINFFREKGAPVVALYDVRELESVRKYSAVKLNEKGRIVSFIEKPERPDTTLIGTAIYAFPWRSLVRVFEYLDGGGSRDSPGHFISWLSAREPVYGYPFSGIWFDIGDAESYARAREVVAKMLPELGRGY